MPAHHASPPEIASPTAMASDGGGELSWEQIYELLHAAETRLREQELTQPASDSAPIPTNPKPIPRLDPGVTVEPYIHTVNGVARVDPSRLVRDEERALASTERKFETPLKIKQRKQEEKKATAGAEWFNMPKTDLTPELRRDLQLLKMRDVVDPKQFYKKTGKSAEVPKYSQVGTIIEGPTDYYSGRVQNKDRKNTLADQMLAPAAKTGRLKRKYDEIQASKTSGKKAFYKALKAKRKGSGKG